MDEQSSPFVIFIVEDDDEEKLLLTYELQAGGLAKGAHFFSDTYELINYFYSREQNSPLSLILLNGFMQKNNIRDAVANIKSVQELRTVPLVVMVYSQDEKEHIRSYDLDVSGYVIKPINAQILKRFLENR